MLARPAASHYSARMNSPPPHPLLENLERAVFLLALTIVTIGLGWVLKPFFAPILWACIIAVLFHPVQLWLERHWGDRRNLIALATLTACVVLVVIPVLFLLSSLVQQGIAISQRIQAGDIQPGQYIDQIKAAFPAAQELLNRLDIDMNTVRDRAVGVATSVSRWIMENAVSVGLGTANFLLKLALMLYVAFFLIRDGRRLVELLVRMIPMGDDRERLLFQKFAEVARATVKGNLLVAMAQGALGGLIFWILDLPAPVLWGVVMTVLSLIPAIGAGLVWLPAAIYLYATGAWIPASVLVGWGVLVIGLADNVLRPILVGRDTKLPDWMVLLSTLGGLTLFGVNGFVVGPLIAVLFIAFWQIFEREFNAAPATADDNASDAQAASTDRD